MTAGRPGRLFAATAAAIAFGSAVLWHLPVTLPAAAVFEGPLGQVWSHRGLGDHEFTENTPAAVAMAAAQGFPGIEIDVHFLADTARFAVIHDTPKPGQALRYLDEFSLPEGKRIWLDFKNLGELSDAQIADAARHLHARGLTGRSYVESRSLQGLRMLDRLGIKTVYWLTPASARVLPALKYQLLVYGIDAVSTDAKHLDLVIGHFGRRSIFLFTLNDPPRIARRRAAPEIAVILTDLAYVRATGEASD